MNIFKWISDELAEHRRYKLEMRRCANCDNMAELVKDAYREVDRLIGQRNEVSMSDESEVNIKDMKPVNTVPSRIRRALATHESFHRIENLKKEYENEH